jgi:polyisoprenoid-binding protein YceI
MRRRPIEEGMTAISVFGFGCGLSLDPFFVSFLTRSGLMRRNLLAMVMAATAVLGLGMAATGDDYTIDPVHSSVNFQVLHLDLAWLNGRFNEFSGTFTLDPADPSKSSFKMTINPETVDTNNTKRDGHLKSPDFFNTKQFPTVSFTSTAVKPIQGGYEVTGNLDLHGVTKPITFTLKGGNKAQFFGGERTGFTTQFVLKRSEFGVGVANPKFAKMLGDDIWVAVGFEGMKKR